MSIDFEKPIDSKEIQRIIDPKFEYYGHILAEYKYHHELIFKGHQDILELYKELSSKMEDIIFIIRHCEDRGFKYTNAFIKQIISDDDIINSSYKDIGISNKINDQNKKLFITTYRKILRDIIIEHNLYKG